MHVHSVISRSPEQSNILLTGNTTKMAHAKKEKADEKKYVQMAPETVQLLAETVGLGHLSPTIATSLSEDATYRTRELAHVSSVSF